MSTLVAGLAWAVITVVIGLEYRAQARSDAADLARHEETRRAMGRCVRPPGVVSSRRGPR